MVIERMNMALACFNEAERCVQLSSLPTKEKAAFAAACTERLFPAYYRFCVLTGRGQPEVLRETLTRLWDDLLGRLMSDQEINNRLEVVMSLVPREDDGKWVPEQAAAEDAAAALAYALRCRGNGASKEAAWAARRVYEAIDHYVINRETTLLDGNRNEERILSHPLVQQELSRQRRDIDELTQHKISIEQLRERSSREAASFLKLQ
jgi:uncharacterized protein YjaG (DUF416 family)